MMHAQLQTRVITRADEFCALKPEWDALWQSAGGHHNQGFRFCWLSWLHVQKRRGRALRCITCRENGKLILVWPLVAYRRALWKFVEPLTPGTVEQTSMLVADGPARQEAVEAAWRTLTRASGADVLFLQFIRDDDALCRLAFAHTGLVHTRWDIASLAVLRDVPDWKSLCKQLGHAYGVRERRLSRAGKMDMREIDLSAEDRAVWIDWILEKKREWAERLDKRGQWLYAPGYRNFLVALADPTEGDVLLRLFAVELDGVIIAATTLGIGKSCHYYLMGSFLNEHAKYSPGTILNEFVIKWCADRKTDIDFGIGTESFKAYWSQGNAFQSPSVQIANSLSGRLYFTAKEGVRRLADGLPRLRAIRFPRDATGKQNAPAAMPEVETVDPTQR